MKRRKDKKKIIKKFGKKKNEDEIKKENIKKIVKIDEEEIYVEWVWVGEERSR